MLDDKDEFRFEISMLDQARNLTEQTWIHYTKTQALNHIASWLKNWSHILDKELRELGLLPPILDDKDEFCKRDMTGGEMLQRARLEKR